jgi:hypothetical protein
MIGMLQDRIVRRQGPALPILRKGNTRSLPKLMAEFSPVDPEAQELFF